MATQAEYDPRPAQIDLVEAEAENRPKYEMADVIRAFGPEYLAQHPVPHSKLKVLRAIVNCRTAALGGKVYGCKECGHEHFAYNSCRNRHCPKCQHEAREEWLEKQIKDLLPVPYFHVVFTLPHELNPLMLANQRQLYGLLFQSAVGTMLQFGRNNVKAHLGIIAILHTWGQEMTLHPHIHMVVTGGGLALDESRWVAMRKDYLFPVSALSKVYRAKFLSGLKRLFNTKKLRFPEALRERSSVEEFEYYLRTLASKEWNVNAKAPFGGAKQVLSYLGRYTHRVAISNHRITGIEHEARKVSFIYNGVLPKGACQKQARKVSLKNQDFLSEETLSRFRAADWRLSLRKRVDSGSEQPIVGPPWRPETTSVAGKAMRLATLAIGCEPRVPRAISRRTF